MSFNSLLDSQSGICNRFSAERRYAGHTGGQRLESTYYEGNVCFSKSTVMICAPAAGYFHRGMNLIGHHSANDLWS